MEFTEIEELKEQLLTCHLCEEEAFSEGVDFLTLPCPCQHTICEKCLGELLRKKRRHESPLCPWCRQEFALPESGKLPTFRYAAELSDGLKSFAGRESISSKSKSKIKNTQERTPQDKKKKNEKLTMLRKLNCSYPNFTFCCAGKSGTFYGTLQLEGRADGLAYLNVVSDGKVTQFGSSHSHYLDMVYNGEELFAVNGTYGRIEVYRNTKRVRSWKISNEPLLWSKICLCPGSRLLVTSAGIHNCKCVEARKYSSFGVKLPCDNCSTQKRSETITKMFDSTVMTVYQDSCWILNKEDKHLWEIPMEMSINTMTCKEPVKHCKVGDVTNACRWGRGKILFTSGRLVKMLDLEEIKTAHDSRVTTPGRPPQRAVAREPTVKASIHNLLSSVYQESDRMLVSDDGYVVVIGQSSTVTAFKFLHTESIAKTMGIADATVSEPKHPSLNEIFDTWMTYLIDRFVLLLGKTCLFLILLLLLLNYRPGVTTHLHNFIEGVVLETCQAMAYYYNTQGRTYGWSNLHISFCEHIAQSSARCRA